MSDKNSGPSVEEIISQLSDSALADTVGLMMQNAVTAQQSAQTYTSASVSSACALILAQG
ncbi:RebB family R body protein [Pseudoalteromonas sp. SMS1]|uniref:Uncharacterized protein n=1 Tax=Pseudoalteromonas luteoviolacea DSM 6061 TaxID=1365250 RepID=A0A161ZVX5_9GAMM|nr:MULTISPECIES: RebB family R body protein [Pseudoalteromonas]KZN35407.1 hypothetical protein N475_18870 [Pseudoalteromonas luteoviolacea DSM 6061]KZN53529.1 hypothetical protein N474_20945 [Pseudoalteromonas luteoviolacea CPMOR-2]MBE0387654.1 hypothetical protein [Pseudoalteromonas luteoviolacea DSM 6061]MCF2859254.1 RebB family R body protein [Pseudoalteromonas sp. SMS1]TQF72435.1 hypothetical protein FLM44_15880 [Pseudoalteromonas luteoviolacea]